MSVAMEFDVNMLSAKRAPWNFKTYLSLFDGLDGEPVSKNVSYSVLYMESKANTRCFSIYRK
jgi:hypothetical protein